MPLKLQILSETLAVCRLAPASIIPDWAQNSPFFSITRTADELSIVCLQTSLPEDSTEIICEPDWRAIKVVGPLDFALIGILAGLAGALAQAGVSLFALSTYDTDYLLVRAVDLPHAVQALVSAGHQVMN